MVFREHSRLRGPRPIEDIATITLASIAAALWLNSCGPESNNANRAAPTAVAQQPVAKLYQPPSSNPTYSTTPHKGN